MPNLGSALLSGLGSIASGLFNTFTGQGMSKDLMRYQMKLQQEAIDRQNFFNSPQEQMKRLAAAGLSPNLVYGSGVDGNQSSAASPSMANVRGQMGNPLQDAAEAYYQQKALDLSEIKTRSEAFESRERQLKLRAETLGQLLDNKFNDLTLNTRVKSLAQKLVNDLQQQKNLEANEAFTWAHTRNEENKMEQIWADIAYIKSRKHLTDEQAATEVVRRRALEAGIHLTREQAREVGHRIRFYDAGSDLREQEYGYAETEFEATHELDKWLQEHPGVQLTEQIIDRIIDKVSRVMGNGRRSGGSRKRRRKGK